MKKPLLTWAISLFAIIASPQQGLIIPLNSSQNDFMKAGKLALFAASNNFQTSGPSVDEQLFPAYGENSIYWILSGSNKGNYVLPGNLPEGYTTLSSAPYSNYDLNAVSHRSVHFNKETDRIAVFRSLIKANEYTVSWEAMYFKNMFETYLYADVIQLVDENLIEQHGLSDSVRILIIPSITYKGSDGSYYAKMIASQYSAIKSKLDAFLQRGGFIYAEGNGVSLLESLGLIPSGSVNYSNSINTGSESQVNIDVTNDHPINFQAASAGNKIYSGAVPFVTVGASTKLATASADSRPMIFELPLEEGKILCNLGLPTAGGMTDAASNKRQLQWTMNAIFYGLSSDIDVVRNVENQLPPEISVGRNAISFDRIDTFEVRVTVRNLSANPVNGIQITETVPDYLKYVEVINSYGTFANQNNQLTFSNIDLGANSQIEIVYRLCTPNPEDPIHEDIDNYLEKGNLLVVSQGSVSYTDADGVICNYNNYHDYAEALFSARIFADTDVNWKNFLGLYYQPFKVFMIMENKQRTPAQDAVYTQYIPKDVPFYWSDQSLDIPILKTPGGKFIDVLRGSDDENNPDYDMDNDGDPDAWLDTSSIYPKGYTITEEEVYWSNPWSHLHPGYENIVYEDINHNGIRAQDLDGDGVIDVEDNGDKIRVWKVTWNIGEVAGYQYYDPYCSYELWIDPPDLVAMAAGIGYAYDSLPSPVNGMFYPNSPDIENPNLTDNSWKNWMERDENDSVIWKQLIFQKINNYEGYTFIDTASSGYKLLPTDSCAGTAPQPHNEFIAVVSLGGEEIDMYHPAPSESMYSKIDYKTMFNEERVTPIRTTYTYWAPLPNPLQFEFLSNNFSIFDTLGNLINFLPSNSKASLVFDIDATTEYTYYWIRNVGYKVDFNDPSLAIDGVKDYGDGVFGYFIYDIPKGIGGYSITLPKNEDGSYNLDSIVQIDGKPFDRWIDNPNTGNAVEIWEDPFEYHVYVPQILIPPALDDDNFDGIDDWIDDRGDRFQSETGFLHDAFMPGNGEDYPNSPAVPFQDDIYGMVESGWDSGADNTYGDDFYQKPGKTHIQIHANFEGRGREGSLDISKGGTLVVEEIFGGSPWVIFSHVLTSFAQGTDIEMNSEVVPSTVKYGTDTAYIRYTINDKNEPHNFDIRFDPYHLSYGYGDASLTTIVGGKDPCSLIIPAISTSSIIDPLKDEVTVTLVPDPDQSIPELAEYPKQVTGSFVEVRIEVMNGTEDNWKNTTITPVIPAELGNTSIEFSYVAYPRPLVPGDDVGTFTAGWRFNQPEGEVLVKPGNNLNLLQPARRGYFIFLFKIDKTLDEGIYKIDFKMNTHREYYTGEDKGDYACDAPTGMICIARKNDSKQVIEFQKLVIAQAKLKNISVQGTSNLEFTGNVKWSTSEPAPEQFDAIITQLPSIRQGNTEEIDLSAFTNFPTIDTTSLYVMQKIIVNSYNTGEKLMMANGETLLYNNPFSGDFIVPGKPLYVYPVGPKIQVSNKIYKVNGYAVEDTLVFEPDKEIYIITRLDVTNTGNDISSNTKIAIYPGQFYEPLVDSMPSDAQLVDDAIVVTLGAVEPGFTKNVYLPFKLHDINEKTGLMDLIEASDITYEGTSIDASYSYSDNKMVKLAIPDFQLYAAVSQINGNEASIQVTAVNRGIPAKNIFLRIFPVVGDGIAELPLAEMEIDSFATDQEVVLTTDYTLPNSEVTKFVAIIDDGNDFREVFELNNTLQFEGGQGISSVKDLTADDAEVFSVYPNPFRDHLIIQYQLSNPASDMQIRIFNMNGSEINRISAIPTDIGLHVINWYTNSSESGNYLLLLEGKDNAGNLIRMKKVVVKQ